MIIPRLERDYQPAGSVGYAHGRINWHDRLATARDFREALGRLTFGLMVYDSLNPLLGPMFAWVSRMPESSCVPLPTMRVLILKFLSNAFQAEAMTWVPSSVVMMGVVFHADAKAEGKDVAIRGSQVHPSGDPKDAHWFTVRLTWENAAWAFSKG